MKPPFSSEKAVLILTPTGRDSLLTTEVLSKEGIQTLVLKKVETLCDHIRQGAGAAVIAEEALNFAALEELVAVLSAQPRWSDFPLIILTSSGKATETTWRTIQILNPVGNATLLERPLSVLTLVGAVQVALRSRNRQYEVRDYIIEREKHEEALHKSKEHFEILARATNDVVWDWDLITSKVWWNLAVTTLFGYSREEVGDRVGWWREHLHPEDRERVIKSFDQVIEGKKKFWRQEYRFRLANGSYASVFDRGYALHDENGKAIRMIGAIVDLTDRKQAEAEARAKAREIEAIMAVTPAALWVSNDAECKNVTGNDESYLLLENKPGSNLSKSAPLGEAPMNFMAFRNGQELDPKELPLQQAVLGGKTVRDIEIELVFEHGKTKYIYGGASPLFDDHGNVRGGVGAFIDITARKQAENELKNLNEALERRVKERTLELQESNAQMESFLYSISHDLRSPLRIMQGFAEILLQEYENKLEGVGKDYLTRIYKSASRMDLLLKDLLAYSRVSRAEIKLEPVNLKKLVVDLVDYEMKFSNQEASVDLRIADVNVLAHEATLHQAILNLINNAFKFVIPEKKPTIKIFTKEDEDKVQLWIEDQGIGIAPEHRDRMFKMFERLHRADLYPGTGIGLAIVQRAIERMGGKVGFESEVNKGSKFWLELPKASA